MPNSEEIRLKISETKKANPTRYWKDNSIESHTKETIEKISKSKKLAKSTVRGDKHHNWKGGVTSKNGKIRGSLLYITWRNEVYKRDNWKCRMCEKKCPKGDIVAHHIREFSDFPELRFVIENGVTLCRSCHARLHSEEKKDKVTGKYITHT